MFRSRTIQADLDGAATPDAVVAVAFKNLNHAASTIELAKGWFCHHVSQFCHGALCRS